jgi:hypothetical protein
MLKTAIIPEPKGYDNARFVCGRISLHDLVCRTDNISFLIGNIFTIKTVLVYQKKIHYNLQNFTLEG